MSRPKDLQRRGWSIDVVRAKKRPLSLVVGVGGGCRVWGVNSFLQVCLGDLGFSVFFGGVRGFRIQGLGWRKSFTSSDPQP